MELTDKASRSNITRGVDDGTYAVLLETATTCRTKMSLPRTSDSGIKETWSDCPQVVMVLRLRDSRKVSIAQEFQRLPSHSRLLPTGQGATGRLAQAGS